MLTEFKGKTAVITGAASGIGRALAQRCCAEGMNVVLADIEKDALEKTRQELSVAGGRILAVLADVSNLEDVEKLAKETTAAFGSVDLLVNNAGVGAGGTAWQSTLKDWTWVMGVNLWSVIYGVRTFVPIMLKQGTPSHVVNTSSIAGLIKGHHSSPYVATKHAVVALSEQLSVEFERIKAPVGVSVLCPEWVNTRINECGRNRPVHLMNEADKRPPSPEALKGYEAIQKAAQAAPPAESMVEPVFDAVRNNRLYIVPHPHTIQWIKYRFDGIMKDAERK